MKVEKRRPLKAAQEVGAFLLNGFKAANHRVAEISNDEIARLDQRGHNVRSGDAIITLVGIEFGV